MQLLYILFGYFGIKKESITKSIKMENSEIHIMSRSGVIVKDLTRTTTLINVLSEQRTERNPDDDWHDISDVNFDEPIKKKTDLWE